MRRALLLVPLALAGGCAANGGGYPSLAPRPIERASEAVPSRSAPVATPDAALDAKIDSLAKRLAEADAAFRPAAGHTRDLIAAAKSAGIGSGAWLDAQTALADLDGYRAESTAVMSALDELAIDRAQKLEPPYPALESLHERGNAQVDAESAAIADLQRQLPGS